MPLSVKQIEVLEGMPLGKWVDPNTLDIKLSRGTISKLLSEEKITAIKFLSPDTLDDADVNAGKIEIMVVWYDPAKHYWPNFVKKINSDYEIKREVELKERVRILEKRIKELSDGRKN